MISYLNSNTNSNISFGSLKENLRLGEDVYRDFKKEFPYLRSNTFLGSKIVQYQGSDRFEKIRPKIERLADKYDLKIGENRSNFYGVDTFEEFVSNIKKIISKNKCANCGEQANIMQYELLKKSTDPHLISMEVEYPLSGMVKEYGSHEFAVFGLKKGARLDNPKTWGQEAVVVDPWVNRVMPANEAIEYYKIKLGFDSTKHTTVYDECD